MKISLSQMPLVVWVKGVAEGPCILNHRFLTYLCQETSGYSRWGKCKETARQDILQCTSFWATAKRFVSLVRKKNPRGILKRESPARGWFLQLLKAVLHRNIYLLHPTYKVLHATQCLWDGVLGCNTKGQIFSPHGNKNVLLQKAKSFPRLSLLQTMHSSHTTHSMFCCHSANIACTLYFLCNCINSI